MDYRYRNEDEMKDSGVEWIGKIPKEWSISRIDKEFNVRNEKVSDKEFSPLSVTKQGILPQLENVAKSDNSDNRKKVCKGDFVINSRADRKGSCGVSSFDGSVSLICNVLTPKRLEPQYVHSLFRNYYFSEEFYRWGSGIVDDLWSTNIEKMKKINVPIPYDREDIKIAKFLDEKTSEFDSIISKKEALIQKLDEAKKSLISEVVTGKVKVIKTDDGYELVERKKEEMRYSGVEWMGDIPKEWNLKRLKYLFEIKKDIAGKLGYDVLSVTQSGIKIKDITKNEGQLSMDYSKYQLVEINDFIMNHMDLLTGFVDCSKFNGVTSPDYRVYKLKDCNNSKEYYNFIFQSCYYNKIFYGLAQGVSGMGRWRLQTDKFLNFTLPLPTVEEQKRIAEVVDKKVEEFKELKVRLELNIEKLKEAKQSLISDVVTGKIEIL